MLFTAYYTPLRQAHTLLPCLYISCQIVLLRYQQVEIATGYNKYYCLNRLSNNSSYKNINKPFYKKKFTHTKGR